MIKFDASKNKKIQMVIETQGIADDKLKFTFSIRINEVIYGFPCMFSEGKVEVEIPPLEEIVNNLVTGTYIASLDVTGDDKYYLNPFNEAVEVKQAPSIKKVSLESDDDMSEGIKIVLSNILEPEEPVMKEEKTEEKKEKTGISAFFDKK